MESRGVPPSMLSNSALKPLVSRIENPALKSIISRIEVHHFPHWCPLVSAWDIPH
jgi:hypothetical protein